MLLADAAADPVSNVGRFELTPTVSKQLATSAQVVDGFTANVRALNENLERLLASADAVARTARAVQTTTAVLESDNGAERK